MSVVNTVVPVEVVVRKTTRTEYVCDGCAARWAIGMHDGTSVNVLHPPRLWWQIGPADGFEAFGLRRFRHACSRACLRKVADDVAGEET